MRLLSPDMHILTINVCNDFLPQSDAGSTASTPTFRQRTASQQDSINSNSSRAMSVTSQQDEKRLCNGQGDSEYRKQKIIPHPIVTNGKAIAFYFLTC